MKMRDTIFSSVLLVAAVCAITQCNGPNEATEVEEPVPVSEDAPWRAPSADFSAALVITDDPEGLRRLWDRPPPAGYQPSVRSVSTAKRGDTVEIAVVFSDCTPDGNGNCDSEVDFKVSYPDGTLYGEDKGAELWKDKTHPAPGALQLGVANLVFRVEPDDPLGDYHIEAAVRDNYAGKELKLVRHVRVVEAEPAG